jgi:hypothetical protein
MAVRSETSKRYPSGIAAQAQFSGITHPAARMLSPGQVKREEEQ